MICPRICQDKKAQCVEGHLFTGKAERPVRTHQRQRLLLSTFCAAESPSELQSRIYKPGKVTLRLSWVGGVGPSVVRNIQGTEGASSQSSSLLLCWGHFQAGGGPQEACLAQRGTQSWQPCLCVSVTSLLVWTKPYGKSGPRTGTFTLMLPLWLWPPLADAKRNCGSKQGFTYCPPPFSTVVFCSSVRKEIKPSIPFVTFRRLEYRWSPHAGVRENPGLSSKVINLMHIHLPGRFHLSFLSGTLSENRCSQNTFLLKWVIQNSRYFWLFMAHACIVISFLVK